MGKKSKVRGGDLIRAPGALDKQIEGSGLAKQRLLERNKQKRKRSQDDQEYIPEDLSSKIFYGARKQEQEDKEMDEDSETPHDSSKRMRHLSLGGASLGASDDEEGLEGHAEYYESVVHVNQQDEEDLKRFINKRDSTTNRTLFDLIQQKIDDKKEEVKTVLSVADPSELNIRELDEEVVELYREVGAVLSKYRSGKIPKAFKIIPKMTNWEQMLYLTEPDKWSSAAMYQATRLFASNLNPRICQRFYNLVLLPRIRDDIDEFQKLNYHLYQAIMKALYKPTAFFKGVLLPLCESGTCTLREATIFGSVLAKASIPMLHAAAAMLKIAEMEYSGANSYFLRIFIDKKYTLPNKAIDAMVAHFWRFLTDERELPVLWHQTLLALVQRYKNDLSKKQRAAIFELIRAKTHYQITPAIRYELGEKENTKSATEGEGMEFSKDKEASRERWELH